MTVIEDYSVNVTLYTDTNVDNTWANGGSCSTFTVETTYPNIYISNSAYLSDIPSGTIIYVDKELTTRFIGGGAAIFTSSLNPIRFTFQIDENGVVYSKIACP